MAFIGTAKDIDLQFASGAIVIDREARQLCDVAGVSPYAVIARHLRGERGEYGTEIDVATSEVGLILRRISNRYRLRSGEHIQVVTTTDRAPTTILIPSADEI